MPLVLLVVALGSAATLALAGTQTPSPLSADLANRTYSLGPEDKRSVTLVDGRGKEAEDGGSAFELLKLHATGDLDGDKAADAAVVLMESAGGTGPFYYLFVLLAKGGTWVQIEQPEWLGDRSVIERVTISRGVVGVRFITHRDQDPDCCPTRRVENRYKVVGGRLVGQ